MLARILFRTPSAASRMCARFALILLAPSLAIADSVPGSYVWPVDGAPVCNASGDQHALFYSAAACGSMQFGWIDSGTGPDSLVASSVYYLPPTGECASFPAPMHAPGVSEPSTAEVQSGIIAIGIPFYCLAPTLAYVWQQGSGAASQLVVNNPSFPPGPFVVADDGDFVRHHPRMAAGGGEYRDTAVVVVWSDERTGTPQIRAQRVNQSGQREWGPAGLLIAPTGAAQTEPQVTRLHNGVVLVVWLDARSGGSDVYALKLLPNGSVAPGWPATGLAFEARPEVAGSVRLVHHDWGSLTFVLWEESGARFGGGRSIVVRKLAPDGTPDPAWDPLGVVLSSSATVEHLQDADVSGSALVAVWTDTRAASVANPTDLYAQWVLGTGAIAGGWPASGLAICTASGRQDAASVSVTDSYAAFAWEDHRGADADVYAELRYSDGKPGSGLWVPNGLPATSAAGDQTAPVVGVGNGGGCFVVWEDARDQATHGLDIYAQAFNGLGEKLDVPLGPPPPTLALGLPRPNPSRGTTIFSLGVPVAASGRVEVFDVAGRLVRTLALREFGAGTRELVFDGRDDAGRQVPPGVYRVLARVGGQTSTRTIVLVQ